MSVSVSQSLSYSVPPFSQKPFVARRTVDSGQTVAGIVVLPRGVVLHDERHEIHVASMKSRRRFLGN